MNLAPVDYESSSSTLGAEIKLRNLRVGYAEQDVLSNIDLDVKAGEFIALLGASGCGKTTLLRALAGFVPVRGGSISVDGQDMSHTTPENRGMAMMFQSYALWPHMNVAQNIGYGLRLRKKSKAQVASRVQEMAALVGLGDLIHRKIGALSGGQRQRVALARALAIDPPVLLLDEPLSNLDAGIRANMRHEIRSLQQRLGLTTVLVTHDREEAMSMADRVVILNQGRIAQVGTPEDVFQTPANPYVARFMGAGNTLHGVAEIGPSSIDLTLDGETHRLPVPGQDRSGVHFPESQSGPVEILFYSDAARLGGASDDCLSLPGTVLQHSYLGSVYRHEIQVGEARIMADNPHKMPIGAVVDVSVPATALSLFPAKSQTAVTGHEAATPAAQHL
ncbi:MULTISPECIES: ABC transporter ATP-binding protein [unclassified Ruegeria]|uniref:ABC transporter ATP-binding protein n=1 Tax=unclassified Ruegeria TaxID=2625375 RepID=UPI001488A7A6|nr:MULTISPECIES: ABC transporter ATP-binding protein [unclassified Ruegeria]NOD77784.1 ATP-binding cassette domain-containing protein [Ruegeria sp. HKCCD4332]NOD88015.1 ATP-binding cassette domain-containing protein [Ruegeria sp. HKCCD4318]NOE14863.1 ATP-binding cassette domain-containing protein [Ruegeria sp. HKCCD4318-2]NOG11534.1 ABC transporter ATP-binding protein [Ruegeria sp. HKCCD4315]